ncbi:MGMT family protein [Deinococcus multiflagellatus]|uniref:MGMT family protein n=1 Tax=Deinococcus multiflagellatus TaxID=1656887 RepID=A0ABW1ZPS5_9DEIO|nr:MGMT family protein [Deinococcus multiflagellatus]MBZ9716122.1 MGMT family protein [Deinococcus multiflagellatus]
MTAPESGFRDRVLALVARIPAGRVMTYGQLALLAGQPGAARQAGFVLNSLMNGSALPWQRVINAQGRVSTHKLGFGALQEGLLRAEGVTFDDSGRCDLARLQWWPEDSPHGPPPTLLDQA